MGASRLFTERHILQAAELVAFDVLDPALRSRGAIQERAKEPYGDKAFRQNMTAFFQGNPTGRLVVPTLQDALERIADIERRLEEIEKRSK